MPSEDTIVAISTSPGRAAIGVVRLSGNQAIEITCSLMHFSTMPLKTQRATLGEFTEPGTGRVLDRVLVTCFRKPHSYTAEDVVEISCHGTPVVLNYLVQCCVERGARPAEPGEFTMRAFLNGRIDLTQAEAVRDLVEARTLYQARLAAQQLEGSLSHRLQPYKNALLDLIARLEAGIDFAEDDVAVASWAEIAASLDGIRRELRALAGGYEFGRIIREGLSLAIVGTPNVGKSSLFNRLLDQDRAIVTPTPGTTRDLVTETASVGGIPLRFVDTAGVRAASDEVERLGVERTLQAIADCDLRLVVLDMSAGWSEEDQQLLQKVRPLGALLVAWNKCDLPSAIKLADLENVLLSEARTPEKGAGSGMPGAVEGSAFHPPVIRTSALTGEGLPELRNQILRVAAHGHDTMADGECITNLRHKQLLADSAEALDRARLAAEQRVHHEMLLLDLYDALHTLDAITGATTTEDLLGIIFSNFCIGK